tara:strand:- start:14 stop:223 length:210 start_codon:yes stop_codon:yes gene_type:complete
MLTWLLMSTGTPQARDSATEMPKFSWCEGKAKASAQRKAPHFSAPETMPVHTVMSFNPSCVASCCMRCP